ncbi:MAG TPA: hypothetical protein VI753_05050 [Anaerolineales bacterium]|nr:hypothetical protein [Anaerolineales bacterium]
MRNVVVVLGKDFLTELKNTIKADLEDKASGDRVDEAFVDIYDDLRTLSWLRHIFSHELAVKVKPTVAQMESFNRTVVVFTLITEIFVTELMGSNDSKTRT